VNGPTSLLVADDEPSVALMVAEMLDREGCGVQTATRVDDARAWIERRARFDLAILDVVMPAMSGNRRAEWLAEAVAMALHGRLSAL
jgi:CheY-like chemotaxis protein